MGIDEAFKFIGITFVFFITLCCGGEMYESIKKHKPLESAAMLRAAGIAALGTLIVIAFGLGTVLIGLVFRLFLVLANRG